MKNSFAVFILSHGRANNIKTLKALKNGNYTGKIYIICDDEDEQLDEYKKMGDVIIFNKAEQIEKTDTIDNFKKHGAVVYARNKCFDIAKNLNLDYFLVLDDDYVDFIFRKEKRGVLAHTKCRNLDRLFQAMIKFLDTSNAKTVALAHGGDYIGGVGSTVYQKKLTRKAMNSFFCKTDRPFEFVGSINEDVNAYITLGSRGELFFTVGEVSLDQTATQQSDGGLTDIYLDLGTYVKSFYSVICMPSCVKVKAMGVRYMRLHHKVNWNNCVPKILSPKWKK